MRSSPINVKSVPNFIVIGAPKCGTTSLYHYISQHPEIYLPPKKELHYFSCEHLRENSCGPGDYSVSVELPSNLHQYKAYYTAVSSERAIGDISPSYLYWSDSSERILTELGRIKILIMLRDPVERAFSQYMHQVTRGLETLGFYDALMAEQSRRTLRWGDIWRYAEHSLYTDKVRKYISVFGKRNIRIILFEDFIRYTSKVLRDLFQFLEVNADFNCKTLTAYNKSGVPYSKLVYDFLTRPNIIKSLAKRIIPNQQIRLRIWTLIYEINRREKTLMDLQSRAYLVQYCRDDVERLSRLLGRRLPWLSDNRCK